MRLPSGRSHIVGAQSSCDDRSEMFSGLERMVSKLAAEPNKLVKLAKRENVGVKYRYT